MRLITLDSINELITSDMLKVNYVINQQLTSDVTLINQLGNYIIHSGGKRLRPMLLILCARALGYCGEKHITAAAFIEFIHTATLLHDDVVDESSLRRGKATANSLFGNAASVLAGDYIYTRSFQMMTSLNSLDILRVMSNATNAIAEGEMQQLINCHDADLTYEGYRQVIYRKTARLFEAAAQCAAILAGTEASIQASLQQYGCYLGTAFQIIDDYLDYANENAAVIGKNLGDDLNEGKPTLPLLHAMTHANSVDAHLIREAIINGNGRHLLNRIQHIMAETGSLQFTRQCALQEAQKAVNTLAFLPESEYKTALISLAKLTVRRDY